MKSYATTNFKELDSVINGQVILPGDVAYEESRKVYNGMIDKKPAVIVRCKNKEDVIAAINYASENQLEVAIRSGGHHGAGLGLVNDGMVIDLSLLKEIKVDPKKRTATIQAGCLLKEIDEATHQHGLALPSGIIGTTGIGGITLGGGLGYLSRIGGLTIDNLLEADIVLASGEVVTASKDNHPDLFWAIRGGGGNFGVVISFKFNLIPIKNVYAGPMFWPIEKSEEVLKFYDKLTKQAPNDLYGFFAFLTVPPGDPFPEHLHMKRVCGIVWCYTGPLEKAEEVFKPIREFGPPILDFVGEIPMPALNGLFDGLYPAGLHWYWKAHYIKELTSESTRELIKHGTIIPTIHSTMHLYPIDGKVHETDKNDTAWANRGMRWAMVIVGVSPDPSDKDKMIKWARDYYDGMIPYTEGGAYVNFMMEEGQERIRSAYGKNYDRLVRVKSKYDPDNFFHINQNIKPIPS
jgi:FAD/FMN-containing dehydrogenase